MWEILYGDENAFHYSLQIFRLGKTLPQTKDQHQMVDFSPASGTNDKRKYITISSITSKISSSGQRIMKQC